MNPLYKSALVYGTVGRRQRVRFPVLFSTVGGAHVGRGTLWRSEAGQSSWIKSRDAKPLNPTVCLFRISSGKLGALVKDQLG